MGNMQATEMKEWLDIDTALLWHLQSNHYPPVPAAMVESCKIAITACIAEDWDQEIPLPKGIRYAGNSKAPAHEIVSAYHLQPWLED